MSRPCFALSVMLCCMACPLLMIGKTHAQDTSVSPSHDPGECIVCPLAHSPLEVCGGYSDYDYNAYWYDDYSVPAPGATTPVDPELEVAESLAGEDAWESDYEDYYADYVFGDEDASGTEDYFESYDDYEPIAPEPADSSLEVSVPEDATVDYEAYEEEWFSYGAETTEEAAEVTELEATELEATESEVTEPEVTEPEATEPEATEPEAIEPEAAEPEVDEAYEALSESASEVTADEEPADEAIEDATEVEPTPAQPEVSEAADAAWGDEELWYREQYGYEDALYREIAKAALEREAVNQLETGYDAAYDEAMAADEAAAEAVAVDATSDAVAELPQAAACEWCDDACRHSCEDESSLAELSEPQSSETAEAPASELDSQQATVVEPAWVTDLVHRMLGPVWTAADDLASSVSTPSFDENAAIYADECGQAWDCEADYWVQPQPEPPSVVLGAADTLDGMASLLQNAARLLRGLASESVADVARETTDNASR